MQAPHIVPQAARILAGSVMGSPQATALVEVRIRPAQPTALRAAQDRLAQQGPEWKTEVRRDGSGDWNDPAVLETAKLFAALTLGVQREAGIAVGLQAGCAIEAKEAGQPGEFGTYTLYMPSRAHQASHGALQWATGMANALLADAASVDLASAVDSMRLPLKPFAEDGLNPLYILEAAYEAGIPVFRPLPGLLVLGTGDRSRWMQSLLSDRTPLLGVQMAQAKHVTARMLNHAGLPGTEHRRVETREDALKTAQEFGFPIVVKPADADRGAGVAAGLTDLAEVAAAFDEALKVSPNVLVERWVPGNTHRLTVQDGQVIRVLRRTAGGVVGDGIHTIAERVAHFQQTPQQQRLQRRLGRPPLTLDREALALLAQQGLTPEHRLAEGQYVRLRRRDNVNTGGVNEELDPHDPRSVHPDNVQMAIAAARVLRLDFAGIDFITTDISRSWLECGGAICEVNAKPQMGGRDSGVYRGLVERMFPGKGRIPAQLRVVPEDAAQQAAIRNRLLREQPHLSVSMSSGLWIDGARATRAYPDSFAAARSLLQRQEVRHALCLMTPKDILGAGLPMAAWDQAGEDPSAKFSAREADMLRTIRPWLAAAVAPA